MTWLERFAPEPEGFSVNDILARLAGDETNLWPSPEVVDSEVLLDNWENNDD